MHLPLMTLVLVATPSLADLRTEYLDGLFRARPHLATFLGDHRNEALTVDYSDAAVRKRVAELDALDKRVQALDATGLSPDDRADLQILKDGAALERLYLTEIREWTWDPRLHDSLPFYDPRETVATRLGDVIHGGYGTDAQRHVWVRAQLADLPRLLAQVQRATVHPSRVHLDQAIKDNQGRIDFFNTQLKEFTQKDPAGEKARLAAVEALGRFQKFLETFPKDKATHDWRLGAALYGKKFPLALQTDLTPAVLADRALAAFQQTRGELFALARKLHAQNWPSEGPIPADADKATQQKVIRRVLAKITDDHPTAPDFVRAHARTLDELRHFIDDKGLLPLPPADTLAVEEMPAFKRGSSGAEYLSPGMLDTQTPWKGTFFVDPVDPSWPADKVDSYLRANNSTEVELTAVHEALPGHHTQAWYARRSLSPLRTTLWSGSFAEGWACYAERQMVDAGLGGSRNDAFRAIDLRGKMIVASNAYLDVKLQTGQMTDAQALSFMEEEGFQETALAERKLLRAKLDSTQLAQYFIGYSEILDFEKAMRAQKGFSQRAFNEALVGHGTIGVKLIRSLVASAAVPTH